MWEAAAPAAVLPAPKRKAAPVPPSAAAQERRQQQMGDLAAREHQREALARIRLELEEVEVSSYLVPSRTRPKIGVSC